MYISAQAKSDKSTFPALFSADTVYGFQVSDEISITPNLFKLKCITHISRKMKLLILKIQIVYSTFHWNRIVANDRFLILG